MCRPLPAATQSAGSPRVTAIEVDEENAGFVVERLTSIALLSEGQADAVLYTPGAVSAPRRPTSGPPSRTSPVRFKRELEELRGRQQSETAVRFRKVGPHPSRTIER